MGIVRVNVKSVWTSSELTLFDRFSLDFLLRTTADICSELFKRQELAVFGIAKLKWLFPKNQISGLISSYILVNILLCEVVRVLLCFK